GRAGDAVEVVPRDRGDATPARVDVHRPDDGVGLDAEPEVAVLHRDVDALALAQQPAGDDLGVVGGDLERVRAERLAQLGAAAHRLPDGHAHVLVAPGVQLLDGVHRA